MFLEFPKPVISIPNLDRLKFEQSEGHKVHTLPSEIEFSSVRHLILSNNTLRTLPNTISTMRNLTALIADHNEIQDLPPSICEMEGLKVLHLNDNQLASLPENFDKLTHLKELRLHGNPLRTPPMDVCVSGVVQPIGRFIRRALEREGMNLLYDFILC
jgi:Leucine-rich repeat (LRR) protein